MFGRKIICVKSINYSYKNIARSISLLDKMVIFVCAVKYSYTLELFTIGESLIVIMIQALCFIRFLFGLCAAPLMLYVRHCQEAYTIQSRCNKNIFMAVS